MFPRLSLATTSPFFALPKEECTCNYSKLSALDIYLSLVNDTDALYVTEKQQSVQQI